MGKFNFPQHRLHLEFRHVRDFISKETQTTKHEEGGRDATRTQKNIQSQRSVARKTNCIFFSVIDIERTCQKNRCSESLPPSSSDFLLCALSSRKLRFRRSILIRIHFVVYWSRCFFFYRLGSVASAIKVF